MERIRAVADQTIRRACGFAGLGIGATMLALSFDVVLAFRVGAVLTTFVLVALLYLGQRAPRYDVRRTELWSVVGRSMPLSRERVQALLGGVLRERYLWHADRAAGVAILFWVVAFVLWLGRLVRNAVVPG
ncbi:MAG: hypothetical protein NZ523_13735 [Elioraea sp.]|nr:hypothetical protein [Elioraea sp.]MDW8443775.1 hypothetical protein [Acetobacteraceae bacterium]